MSDFDYFKFYELTDDIEKLLGTLRGNELVREYYDKVIAESDDVLYVHWTTPDPTYPVLFLGMPVPYVPDETDADTHRENVQLMEKYSKEAFGYGATWAEGIGPYLRNLCADVAIPVASMIKSSAQDFRDSAASLESVIPVDWTDLDFNSWTGLSSDACEQVVDNFQAKFRDEYAFYFTYAQAIYSAGGAVVVQTQKGLNKTVEGVRDNLKKQCAAWQETGGVQPDDVSATPPWLADVGKIVSNTLDLIPVVSEVKGKVENLAGIADGVLGLMGEEPTLEQTPFDAMSANQAYTKCTTILEDDYVKAMKDGLDKLQTERANAVVEAQNGIHPWFMDTLDGVDKEHWEHEAEA